MKRCVLWFAIVVLFPGGTLLAEEIGPVRGLSDRARDGLLKAGRYWAEKVASHGGFVWEYSTDLATWRRGESKDLPASTNWVQAGTPMMGEAFLLAHTATGDARMLEAALAAGHCLEYGQLESGGWHYSIEHDPLRVRAWYHHLGDAGKGRLNTTTFDDDNSQSALRFLMELDRYVDDARIDGAIARALALFLQAQYRGGPWDGAWPQRYPPPEKGYGAFPTFNDNTMSDCVRTVLKAYRLYGRQDTLDAVRRCLAFYLRSQLPDPQGAWAQQYDPDLKPAWARRFEPPAVTGGESRGNAMLLMDMAVEFEDAAYFDAVGRCVEWYRRSRLGGTPENGIWARFYELGSNRPLYFTRTYELSYDDSDLPVHYSFKGNYGVDAMIRRYEALKRDGFEEAHRQARRSRTAEDWGREAESLVAEVERVLRAQDDLGRWVKVVPRTEQVRDEQGRVGYAVEEDVKLSLMYSRTAAANMRTLSRYLIAVAEGPAVEAPDTLPPGK
ncbi:MAG: hypothetical protein JXR77_04610 [Lentisphaeria bacterium]|nr:hypothetical protein [Lentisphaeria bacterium]